jgi:2,4-dienoyl-CoA reductase-like NADH-dependent reductase (Old Yellow Enzyme family)/nucleotide-binding universal stress UspA family protein
MTRDLLFEPVVIGGCRSRNRIAALPLFTGYARPDGGVTPLLREHYWRLASSGAGLVVVANVAVARDGRTSPRTLRLDADRFIPELAGLAATIQRRGALACIQLNHAGRFARTERPLLPAPFDAAHLDYDVAALKAFMHTFPFSERFGFTARFMQMHSKWRWGMTPEDRRRVVDDFGQAARRAVDAGFDMLELHGATGYLLAQFLSAFTNRPPGPWAGDFDTRSAFVRDVMGAVKAAIPQGFPIGYRLLVHEWVPDGIDLDEATALAGVLKEIGVAYLSVSAGTYSSMFNPATIRLTRRPAYLRADTRALRRVVNIPLILGGRVFRPSMARKVLAEDGIDMIGLGRPLLTDPGWVEKARTGKRVHVCVDCRHCLKRVIREKGLACARWPEIEIERVDLECALHVRLNACFLFTSPQSLGVGLDALPAKLSGRETLKTRLVYIAQSGPAAEGFRTAAERHWLRFRKDWQTAGQRVDFLERVSTTTTSRAYDNLLTDARQDGFGMIVLADGPNVPSGEVLASKWREGIFIAQTCHGRASKIFSAVDLSPSTHVLLRFLAHAFLGRPCRHFRFVHVLDGSAQAARRRWEKMLPLSGWDADTPLELVPPGPEGVAGTLLDAAAGWDVVIVGRRGMSRIKSLLLGSVSRRILRGAVDATVVIVS